MTFARNIKLERMKSNIASDFAGALETAYKLPLMFSESARVGLHKFKTDIYVVEIGEKMYPLGVFEGTVIEDKENNCEAAILRSEYESLFDWVGKFDGQIVYGIKLKQPVGKQGLSKLLKKLDIQIDTKNMSYALGEPKSCTPEASQPAK